MLCAPGKKLFHGFRYLRPILSPRCESVPLNNEANEKTEDMKNNCIFEHMYLRNNILRFLLVCAAAVLLPAFSGSEASDSDPTGKGASYAFHLVETMFAHCSSVNAMACEVIKKERFGDEYVEAESRIKMTCEPYCVYLKQTDRENGAELLYRKGENNGKVLVNPNGFPWINLNLDPYGALIRNKQHHLIHDIGFSKFNTVLSHLLDKYDSQANEFVQYNGEKEISGRLCHVVDIVNTAYRLTDYTVGPGETTTEIAQRFMINEYRIVELNEAVKGYGEIDEGLSITIPNDYAPDIRLYIDAERYIPMRFEVYDEKGSLFEAYQYENVQLNANFESHELTPDYPAYGF